MRRESRNVCDYWCPEPGPPRGEGVSRINLAKIHQISPRQHRALALGVTWQAGRPAAAGDRQGDSFGHCLATMKRTHSGPKKIAPPVDNLKMVTPYPKARATMNETTLSTLVPLGTPIVMHLYTG